ncbi:hypothetical protein OEZ85_008326 [Tetradesmus obliquus]|uniref:Right handed beta helix domain-containing protein n=1 Tax=Tetradesmus obliquus TaxID=3088 RepID=A0ABY8TII6_TETOB|nr:hypothetical protein OEZ85_008326 [Tetradesmus obliquus]
MQPGQVVRVVMDNPNNALLRSLNEGMFPPFEPYNNRQDVIRWTSRIKSILRNPNRIELERSLPFELDTAWQPEVHDWNNEQYGVKRNFTGVADMTIRFPAGAKFAGEGKELGYNGLYFYGTAHSWVRNVVFENAEFGVAFDSGSFNTVENVTFRSSRPTDATMPYTGGRGIWNKGTFDNLVNWFYFETSMLYEISTSYFAVGNVYANGKGTDLTLELMYGAAYGNLFTNIHLGLGSKPFGWVTRGQDAAGFNTFWNIRTANDKLALPPATWAPRVLFVNVEGAAANASRGDRVLRVANSSAISVGQWYRVLQKDPGDGSLMWELNGGAFPVVEAQKGYADPCRFLSRVVSKGADWIRLERPLPFKVDTRWAPEIHKFMPMLNDATGFEYFTLDFPWSPYPGHFLEAGFNGLHLNQVVNGWVRGVTVRNSDMGVYTWGSVFTTISGLTLTNSKPRAWYNGHRGLWMEHGSDSMVTNFNITDRFVHDISVTGTEHGTVIMNGAGFDINLDHHRMAPYQNLFTNIDVGLGSRVFYASGDANWGPHAGVFSTFHNLQSDMRFLLPSDDDFGANLTFIGLPSDDPRDPPGLGWHVELLTRPFPPNLYTSFTNTRAARNLGAGVCAPLSIC